MCGEAVETALVEGAQRGDAAARDELFRAIHRRILGYQLKLHRGNLEEAQDASQESVVRVIHGLPTLREPARFVSWSLRIATNVWRDRIRARRPVPLPQEMEAAPESESAETGEFVACVLSCLGALDEPYRLALTLRYLEGMDYEAMSEVLEVGAATLRSHVARGLEMVRSRLEQGGHR